MAADHIDFRFTMAVIHFGLNVFKTRGLADVDVRPLFVIG
jgi:hypothetical protein